MSKLLGQSQDIDPIYKYNPSKSAQADLIAQIDSLMQKKDLGLLSARLGFPSRKPSLVRDRVHKFHQLEAKAKPLRSKQLAEGQGGSWMLLYCCHWHPKTSPFLFLTKKNRCMQLDAYTVAILGYYCEGKISFLFLVGCCILVYPHFYLFSPHPFLYCPANANSASKLFKKSLCILMVLLSIWIPANFCLSHGSSRGLACFFCTQLKVPNLACFTEIKQHLSALVNRVVIY